MQTKTQDINKRFTPEEYEAYQNQPWWKWDDVEDKWDSEDDYKRHWIAYVNNRLRESRESLRPNKTEWAKVVREYERYNVKDRRSPSQVPPEESKVPMLNMAVDLRVALMCDGAPIPVAMPRQDPQDKYVGGLNYYAAWTLDANNFESEIYDWATDGELLGLSLVKLTIDDNQEGPFGKPGRVVVEQCEPRCAHPDPLAKKAHWKYMRWFIYADWRDVSELRAMYPLSAAAIKPELTERETESKEYAGKGRLTQSPMNDGRPTADSEMRERCVLKEMWLKDESMRFECDYYDVDNTDETGALIDKSEPSTYQKKRVDEDGYVVGKWVKRFPKGRVLIIAGDCIIMDCENPYWCGTPPYAWINMKKRGLFPAGNASDYQIMVKKMNDLLIRMHRMAVANIERPTFIDQGVFDAPRKWSIIPLLADAILQMRQGIAIPAFKLPPGEIPVFILPLYLEYKDIRDELIGVPRIMQGQLVEGSQIGASTMSGLQEMAASKIRMSLKFLKVGLKDFGRILYWHIRQTYHEAGDMPYPGPEIDPMTGKRKMVDWNADNGHDSYDVEVDIGSSLPGAKEGAYMQMKDLYKLGASTKKALLQAGKVPGYEQILADLQKEELEKIKAQMAGKQIGLDVKEATKPPKEMKE